MLPMSTASSHSDRPRPLLSERDVADLFMVAPRTVRRWADTGLVTRIRVGGISRYRRDEIEGLFSPDPGRKERA
jgi:hypothetical protein